MPSVFNRNGFSKIFYIIVIFLIIGFILSYYLIFNVIQSFTGIISWFIFLFLLAITFIAIKIVSDEKRSIIIKIIVFILFFSVATFYLTDNPPKITLEVIPNNPKTIREVKVHITIEEDRCFGDRRISQINNLISYQKDDVVMTTHNLRVWSWRASIPGFWCEFDKVYQETIDFSKWPEERLQKLGNDIFIKYSANDTMGNWGTAQIRVVVPR